MVSQEIIDKVQAAISHIRPFLKNDGGDISLVSITDDMVATVQLMGACDGCQYSSMTMRNGVEETIMRQVPEIKQVIAQEASHK